MKNLYDPANAAEIRERLARLRADSPRQWGKMTPAQVSAHCTIVFDMALGDITPKWALIGRVIGGMVRRKVVSDDAPFGKNSPTAKEMVIHDERDFETERGRLLNAIDRFAAGGPAKCTKNPHPFFGPMKPDEWAILMYKHVDHHLRQFGV